MNKKTLFIFVALFLPAMIFLFLKMTGSNRFDVQVYYTDQIEIPGCEENIQFPYSISQGSEFQIGKDSLTLIILEPDSISEEEVGLLVICEKTIEKPVRILIVNSKTNRLAECVQGIKVEQVEDVEHCILLVQADEKMVLIDGLGRIRGYYKFPNREELDRLAVEIQILTDNGENRSVSGETN